MGISTVCERLGDISTWSEKIETVDLIDVGVSVPQGCGFITVCVPLRYMVRPHISEETIERLEGLTEEKFRVSESKVSVDDRVALLCKMYEERNSDNSGFAGSTISKP